MIYRRVTEITEIDQPTIPGLPNHWTQQPSFGQTGFHNIPSILGPFPNRQRSMQSWEELSLSEEVRSFKRVWIVSNIKKARKGAFASWEDRTPWGTIDMEWKTTAPFDDHEGGRFTTTIGTDAGLRSFGPREPVVTAAHPFPPYDPLYSEHRFCPHISDSNEDDRGPTSDHCPSAMNHGVAAAKQHVRSPPKGRALAGLSGSGRGADRVSEWAAYVEPGPSPDASGKTGLKSRPSKKWGKRTKKRPK